MVAIYATFLNRAFDQVLMDVALHKCGVTFVLDRAGVTGDDGASHNGMWDMSILQVVPGLRLAAPRDGARVAELLREAVAVDDAPTVLRIPKGPPPADIEAVDRAGAMDVLVRDGARDVLIVGIGSMAAVGVEVAARLADQGIGVTVVDPRWVKPWDPAVVDLARDHRLVVCVEDNGRVGGCGSTLLQLLNDEQVDTPFRQHGIPRSSSTMPSGTRSSSASGSPPRRSRAASSRTSPPSTAATGTPDSRGGSSRVPADRGAGLTDRAPALRPAAVAAVLALLLRPRGVQRRRPGPQPPRQAAATPGHRRPGEGPGAAHPRPAGARGARARPRPVPAAGRPPRQGADGAAAPLLPQPGAAAAGPVQLPGHRPSSGRGCAVPDRWGDDVHIPQVALTMQLADFDAVPVERTVGFVFSFRDGRATIVSDRTATGKPLFEGTPAPWDLTAISVREAPGVLGIFDRRTRASAATGHGGGARRHRPARPRAAVHLVGPRRGLQRPVPGVLASFTDVPGGAIEHLGALTFPTYAERRGRSPGRLHADAADAQLGAAPASRSSAGSPATS